MTYIGCFTTIPVQNSICRQWWRIVRYSRSMTISRSVLVVWIWRYSTARWRKIYKAVKIIDSRAALVETIWHWNRNVWIKTAIHLERVQSVTNIHFIDAAAQLHVVKIITYFMTYFLTLRYCHRIHNNIRLSTSLGLFLDKSETNRSNGKYNKQLSMSCK